ncbi:hypothetical protein K3495_g1337 [Podosphaera aphanis]|nr:hypothetical protein K3495_g1337 [Podosphaera aphanis]
MDLPLNSSSTGRPGLIPMTNRTEYQQKVGSLMFVAVCSRPDIAFHIGRLSQQLQDPAERHDSGIKELGRYLRTTIGQKIRFGPPHDTKKKHPGPHPDSYLKLYSDADWANMEGRKSISGYVALLYGGPVSKARQVALTRKNIIRVWKWTGVWPVNAAKPLSSPLMLTSTSTTSQPTCKAHPGKLSVKSNMKIANETSPVLLLTPRKKDELRGQLRFSSEGKYDKNTHHLLFRKIQKSFEEKHYQIAAAQQKIEALESQVEAGRARKGRRVQTHPNSKFADIESIRRAQIDAGDFINNTNETSDS